jgi:hypothetical protein
MHTVCSRPFQIVQRQVTRLPIISSYLMHDFDGLSLSAASHEVFWTFVEVEDEKADEEEEKHQSAHCEKEISPSHVARAWAWAFWNGRGTRKVGYQRPCNLHQFMRSSEETQRENHNTRLPISWPKAHQMDKTTNRYWCDAGTNSAKQDMNTKIAVIQSVITQKDGRVNRKVSAHSNRPYCSK